MVCVSVTHVSSISVAREHVMGPLGAAATLANNERAPRTWETPSATPPSVQPLHLSFFVSIIVLQKTENVSIYTKRFRQLLTEVKTKLRSPGSTCDFWGCILGPTLPLGGEMDLPYFEDYYWWCFQGNFPCSILYLSFWAANAGQLQFNLQVNLSGLS